MMQQYYWLALLCLFLAGSEAAIRKSVCENNGEVHLSCQEGTLISVEAANYGRLISDDGTPHSCPHEDHNNQPCVSNTSLSIVSGMCNDKQSCSVESSNSVFEDPCDGTYKYLEVVYSCYQHGNFPYACEGEQPLYLSCPAGAVLNIRGANYGRLVSDDGPNSLCHGQEEHENEYPCSAPNSFSIVSELCQDKPSCSIVPNNDRFGDPCVDTYKYLEVNYECIPSHLPYACEGDEPVELQCPPGQYLHIRDARYGRSVPDLGHHSVCHHHDEHLNENPCIAANSFSIVSDLCQGKESCRIEPNNDQFEGDPCPGTYKYLEVDYACLSHTYEDRACEEDRVDLHCPGGSGIDILWANFGRLDSDDGTPENCHSQGHNNDTNCYDENSMNIMKLICDGRSRCGVLASTGLFGDPCVDTYKYLDVKYQCRE